MAQINKSSDYFNTKLYTGDMVDGDGTGHTQSITGVGFQPDWVWHKGRSNARTHILVDSVRGTTNYNWLISSGTGAELTTNTNGAIKSIDSDGITLENGTDSSSKANNAGANGETYVFWNWLAGGSASSNTDGSITSSVSANTTSGFSIVSYTGTANSSDTVGHGLGVVPKMIIVKRRDDAGGTNWCVYHVSNNNTKVMFLESTSAGISNIRYWNNTTPTSSVFSIGNDDSLNASGGSFIAYCFAEKKGFSKFGSYTGNGSTDGTFVYTGFKPAFVIAKRSDGANNWIMHDNKRPEYNPTNILFPNLNNAELSSNNQFDLLSNGFKCRASTSDSNASGGTYIYMAFAENPLVGTNNIPATAR